MQNVLVPYDGSPSAERAVDYLINFAKVFPQLKVHLINVQTEAKLYGNYVSPAMLEQLNAGALDHAAEINAKAAERLKAAGILHSCHEVMGEVVTELVKAVRQHGCNTVVMGTRGMSNLGNLVMGSVATRVVHEVPVPVLLVK
ncbi:MAG: universal stress protein [Gammaproteobacteria bacterium HGW-Gammaproteobacteria-6]|nr:MAG: universal stress protein [Gammaproteobacteria bacterium HGW-Gammaproteobacteria-6]